MVRRSSSRHFVGIYEQTLILGCWKHLLMTNFSIHENGTRKIELFNKVYCKILSIKYVCLLRENLKSLKCEHTYLLEPSGRLFVLHIITEYLKCIYFYRYHHHNQRFYHIPNDFVYKDHNSSEQHVSYVNHWLLKHNNSRSNQVKWK